MRKIKEKKAGMLSAVYLQEEPDCNYHIYKTNLGWKRDLVIPKFPESWENEIFMNYYTDDHFYDRLRDI